MTAQPGRPDLSSVSYIFFDLDDTLCGYWDASKAALREAFEAHGPEGFSTDEHVQHWAAAFREFSPTLKQTGWYEGYLLKGEPTRTEQMRLTLKRMGIEDEELAMELSEAYAAARNSNLALFTDALNVLETLKPLYPMGLITNGPADIQRQEIATLGIERYFDNVYIEGEMGRGKPLPEVFEQIASEVGRQPHEILMVGNSYAHDVKPALRAGWFAIWVRRDSDVPPSYGNTAKPEERPADDPVPHATIGNLSELLELLPVRAEQKAAVNR